jgi:hypothetical protein
VPDPDYMSQGSGGGTPGLPPPVDAQTEVESIADAVVVDAPSAKSDPGTEHDAVDPKQTEAMEESNEEGRGDLAEPPDAPPEKTDADDEDDSMGDPSAIEPVRRGVEVMEIADDDDDRVKMETEDAERGPVAGVTAGQRSATTAPTAPTRVTGTTRLMSAAEIHEAQKARGFGRYGECPDPKSPRDLYDGFYQYHDKGLPNELMRVYVHHIARVRNRLRDTGPLPELPKLTPYPRDKRTGLRLGNPAFSGPDFVMQTPERTDLVDGDLPFGVFEDPETKALTWFFPVAVQMILDLARNPRNTSRGWTEAGVAGMNDRLRRPFGDQTCAWCLYHEDRR